MKKRVILTLEVESGDEFCLSDDFIQHDISQELNCASNFYSITSFETCPNCGERIDEERREKNDKS